MHPVWRRPPPHDGGSVELNRARRQLTDVEEIPVEMGVRAVIPVICLALAFVEHPFAFGRGVVALIGQPTTLVASHLKMGVNR